MRFYDDEDRPQDLESTALLRGVFARCLIVMTACFKSDRGDSAKNQSRRGLEFARLARRLMRDIITTERSNACKILKRDLLASPEACAHMIEDLGGESTLTAWEAAYRRAAQRAANASLCSAASPAPQPTPVSVTERIWQKARRAHIRAERARCAGFTPPDTGPSAKLNPVFRLPPIRRARRSPSLERHRQSRSEYSRAAHSRWQNRSQFAQSFFAAPLPPIIVTPDALRRGAQATPLKRRAPQSPPQNPPQNPYRRESQAWASKIKAALPP